MIELVVYPWVIKCDTESTSLAYSKMEYGHATICTCSMCQNFRVLRESVYPESILKVFEELGIDYRKECDISQVCKLKNGRHLYFGRFNYVGDIVYMDEKYRPSEEIDTIKVDVNDVFSWHFTHLLFDTNPACGVFGDEKLIEIFFSVELPWAIDLPEP